MNYGNHLAALALPKLNDIISNTCQTHFYKILVDSSYPVLSSDTNLRRSTRLNALLHIYNDGNY